MGFFSSKKESISLSAADEMLQSPRALRGMSKKEIKDLQRRAEGKTNIIDDVRAAAKDAKRGRGTGGVGKAPEPRTGKGLLAPDSSKTDRFHKKMRNQ